MAVFQAINMLDFGALLSKFLAEGQILPVQCRFAFSAGKACGRKVNTCFNLFSLSRNKKLAFTEIKFHYYWNTPKPL